MSAICVKASSLFLLYTGGFPELVLAALGEPSFGGLGGESLEAFTVEEVFEASWEDILEAFCVDILIGFGDNVLDFLISGSGKDPEEDILDDIDSWLIGESSMISTAERSRSNSAVSAGFFLAGDDFLDSQEVTLIPDFSGLVSMLMGLVLKMLRPPKLSSLSLSLATIQ